MTSSLFWLMVFWFGCGAVAIGMFLFFAFFLERRAWRHFTGADLEMCVWFFLSGPLGILFMIRLTKP